MKKNWSNPEVSTLGMKVTNEVCPFFNKSLVSTLAEVGEFVQNENGLPLISEDCCKCSNYNSCADAAGTPVNQIVTGCSA